MARFARRMQSGTEAVALTGPDDGPTPEERIACRLQVVAVGTPDTPEHPTSTLISGLLRGPFPLLVVQFTTRLPRASWPEPGAELPAMVEVADHGHFGVTWSVLAPSALVTQPITTTQWHRHDGRWDQGSDGSHLDDLVRGLRRLGVGSAELGDRADLDAELAARLSP